jgi:hypothetical protein
LAGKDSKAHLQYLPRDRSTLTAKCIATAINDLSIKRYVRLERSLFSSSITLIQPRQRGGTCS